MIGSFAAMVSMDDSFAIFNQNSVWNLTYANDVCNIEEIMPTSIEKSPSLHFSLSVDHKAVQDCIWQEDFLPPN